MLRQHTPGRVKTLVSGTLKVDFDMVAVLPLDDLRMDGFRLVLNLHIRVHHRNRFFKGSIADVISFYKAKSLSFPTACGRVFQAKGRLACGEGHFRLICPCVTDTSWLFSCRIGLDSENRPSVCLRLKRKDLGNCRGPFVLVFSLFYVGLRALDHFKDFGRE